MKKKFFIKLEILLGIYCLHLIFEKFLNWLKPITIQNLNILTVSSIVIALAVFIFFEATMKKNHEMALHFATIYCCICTICHFETLMANLALGLIFLVIACVFVIASIHDLIHREQFSEEDNLDNDQMGFHMFTGMFVLSQLMFYCIR